MRSFDLFWDLFWIPEEIFAEIRRSPWRLEERVRGGSTLPMLCDSCQKKPATVHLTDVTNNSKQELHLCESHEKDADRGLCHAIRTWFPDASLPRLKVAGRRSESTFSRKFFVGLRPSRKLRTAAFREAKDTGRKVFNVFRLNILQFF